MFDWGAAALFLLMVMTVPADAEREGDTRYAQAVVREQIVIRLSVRRPVPAPASQIEWREGNGQRCVSAATIVGATQLSRSSVDLVMRDQSRVRAKLDSNCPALDYYHGFYIEPRPDGQICADRDIIRSRVGGQCAITAFSSLQPVARP